MRGKWVFEPALQTVEGDDPRLYRIARIEKYIDVRGQTKEAIAYGQLKKDLLVWYDLEKKQQAFPHWVIPVIPKWENTENWHAGSRNLNTTEGSSLRGGRGYRGNDRGTERGRGRGNRGGYRIETEDARDSGIGRGAPIGQ